VRKLVLPGLLLLLPLTACGGDGDDQTLTVLAASSLTETFDRLAQDFEDEHPGVDVNLVLGSSTTLAEQAADGAPGQVLATADERSMRLAEDVLADPPAFFVSNRLVLVAPPDNPAGIGALGDLDAADVDYVRCAETAPCGAVAAALLADAGITAPPASEEVDVKSVLARVVQGEADAGLVYRTDAVAAGDAVTEVATDDLDDYGPAYATNYAIAPVVGADGDLAELAAEFVTLVRSSRARTVFDDAGCGGVVRQ
jgi:molybdate transport system substrate-binding protein